MVLSCYLANVGVSAVLGYDLHYTFQVCTGCCVVLCVCVLWQVPASDVHDILKTFAIWLDQQYRVSDCVAVD